jgi:hypothetical protein
MPDDEQDTAGPPPRPTPPKLKRDPIVIEGKAKDPGGLGPKPIPSAAAPAPRGLARPIAAGAVGGAIGALLTIGGVWLFDTGPDPTVLARRMDALDAAQSDDAVARKTLADRIAALESAGSAATTEQKSLSDKLSALAAAPATSPDDAKRLSELEAATAQQKALGEQAAALKTAAAASAQELEKRIAALEAAHPASQTPVKTAPESVPDPRVAALAVEQKDLSDRLGKLEAAVFSAKAETRVAAEQTHSAEAPAPVAARAIAALALQARVRAGERFATEISTLQAVGADAAALEPLRPYADVGVPTFAALLSLFREAAPRIDAVGRPAGSGGAVDRLLGEVQGLVKVRKVGESPGAEAGGDASRIAAALASGDLDGAISAAQSLPDAPRAAATDWVKAARMRLDATKAADALAERSIAELGAAKR